MKNIGGIQNKGITIFYRILMPLIFVACLLIVSSFISRRLLLNNFLIDILVRALISGWFIGLYLRISNLQSYSIYPNKRWTKNDIETSEKYLIFLLTFLFSLGCAFLTWWSMKNFIPLNSSLIILIAIINGTIIFIPLSIQYWVLKV